jgi:hypothetical protein
MQCALDDYQDNFAQLISSSMVDNTPISPREITSIRKTAHSIMSYIAAQLMGAGGEAIFGSCYGDSLHSG